MCNQAKVAVISGSAARQVEAEALADALALPFQPPEQDDFQALLVLDEAGLCLQLTGAKAPGPVAVDFVTGAMGHRRRLGVGRNQPLAKAVGIKPDYRPRVWDVTAGLGRDAFVLALLGCHVYMLEQSPIIAALLADGLDRARQFEELTAVVERLSLQNTDALAALTACEHGPQVVYLDPMYPSRSKSALVKKEMRVLRAVVGDDGQAASLLEAALQCAEKRVVVKRPRLAEAIAGPKPSYSLDGKTTRFDIYLV